MAAQCAVWGDGLKLVGTFVLFGNLQGYLSLAFVLALDSKKQGCAARDEWALKCPKASSTI
eukprot:146989-Amphidinium_carterae.1